jgi:hypothetical protein
MDYLQTGRKIIGPFPNTTGPVLAIAEAVVARRASSSRGEADGPLTRAQPPSTGGLICRARRVRP